MSSPPAGCALPPVCPLCHGKGFVYLPAWRTGYPGRRPADVDETSAFTSGATAGDTRMFVSTERRAASVWSAPTQENLPLSLRICSSCGAAQPYVDPTQLQRLIDGARDQVVVVEHAEPGALYR